MFKHLSLISTSGGKWLMVLVLIGGGKTNKCSFWLSPTSQEQLSCTAKSLTEAFEAVMLTKFAKINQPYSIGARHYKLIIEE
jgi:hypothetical protein